MVQTPTDILLKQQDTTLRWYPLRIFHSSVRRQRDLLEALSGEEIVTEAYVPQRLIDAEKQEYVPALLNYVFVRCSLPDLQMLKNESRFSNLRYIMRYEHDKAGNRISRVAHITDQEMENFRQVILNYNEQVEYLQNNAFAFRPGQKVRITEGSFAGVEGTLKSIRKHACVVVVLSGIMAVAITGIHRKHLVTI